MLQRLVRIENVKWFALIALVAVVLRLYAIDRLPPGLFGDEAVEGLDALDVLAGNFQIWFHAHLGREPLFVYLVALSYALFGVTPLSTRLPALIAGLATIPATFIFVREWAMSALQDKDRATRLALLTTGLLAISFWHIEMNRDAHRDILLPLVEVVGYFFLWRGMRTRDWKFFAVAGAVLGLAVYTYSPGRFVGVFIALYFAIEFLIAQFGRSKGFPWRGVSAAALCAILVMLPFGIYFAQNPVQFIRRFDSASIFNASQPMAAFMDSMSGNLAQFVIPGAGYQSLHYNLPGKPVFDLFLAPWFLAGVFIAFARLKDPAYRFLLLWFVVMMMPPFLTSDMIPKGVRGFGTMPGVLLFIAIAMDALLPRPEGERVAMHRRQNGTGMFGNHLRRRFAIGVRGDVNRLGKSPSLVHTLQKYASALIALTFIGSTIWTTYDYFIVWANLPDLPIAFDSDYAEAGDYVNRQPPNQPIYVSAEVYRHPTFMLLGMHVPTSQFFERATRVKEFDAKKTLVAGDPNAIVIFVRDQSPSEDWYRRLAPQNVQIATGKFFAAYRLRDLATPQALLNVVFNPLITLIGYSRFADEPRGMAIYWRIAALPDDREEMRVSVSVVGASGQVIAQKEDHFGYPPMEWAVGETVVEWFEFDAPEAAYRDANQFVVELARGSMKVNSPMILYNR